MTKDGLPGEASQEGQSRPVSLAGLVLVLCVALMGVMGVSITLPILPKLGAVFHQDAAGVALLITCFTLPSAFMTPVAGVLADRFGRKAVLLPAADAAGAAAVRLWGNGVRFFRFVREPAGMASHTRAGGRTFGDLVRDAGR